jgi:hypothetical protein
MLAGPSRAQEPAFLPAYSITSSARASSAAGQQRNDRGTAANRDRIWQHDHPGSGSFGKAFDGTHDLVCVACAGEVRQVLIFGTVRTTTDCVASWAGATGPRSVVPSADTSTATLSLLRWSRRCPCNRPTIFSISVIGITMRHVGCSSTWPFPRGTDVNRSNLATLSVTKTGPSFSANISIMGFAAWGEDERVAGLPHD